MTGEHEVFSMSKPIKFSGGDASTLGCFMTLARVALVAAAALALVLR